MTDLKPMSLRDALRDSPCPRPANGQPEDQNVGDCFDKGLCGCQNGEALRVASAERAPDSPTSDDMCQCVDCGRMHRRLGKPPLSVMEQIARDMREGTFPRKSEKTLQEEATASRSPAADVAEGAPAKYATLADWLNETEGYGVRAERIPPGAYPWVAEAWKLGAASRQSPAGSADILGLLQATMRQHGAEAALEDAAEEIARLRSQSATLPTIDDVPSCGQENDYRRARPSQPVTTDEAHVYAGGGDGTFDEREPDDEFVLKAREAASKMEPRG